MNIVIQRIEKEMRYGSQIEYKECTKFSTINSTYLRMYANSMQTIFNLLDEQKNS